MYDVGIIGTGPAGVTLARLLGKRFKVLLIGDHRRKCCGGILSPEAQNMLGKLDLAVPKEVLVNPQPFSVAVLDTATRMVRHYQRQYVNINRAAFDDWLLSLVPKSVDVRIPCCFEDLALGYHPPDTTLLVYFTDKRGNKHSAQVKLLVGADGANSIVRTCGLYLGNARLPKEYIALQDWYAAEEVKISNPLIDFWNDYTGVFDTELTDFYAWTIPKDDVLLVGGAIPKQKECRKRFERFKEKMSDFGLQLGKPFRREAGAIFRPLSNKSISLGMEQYGSIALIGEAAGLISPSSAEGISFALASAFALSESFLPDGRFSLRLYEKNVNPLLWKIFFRQFKIPAMFNPILRKWIMKGSVRNLLI
ncbi:MAG: FAD-binding protein [Planctomycetaceae bacterium]|nr:FAD-binding protein [Planctomycetaceae bacterium]